MNNEMRTAQDRVITAQGWVAPSVLGQVMMREHRHCDIYDGQADRLIVEERPCSEERRRYLLQEAVPLLSVRGIL